MATLSRDHQYHFSVNAELLEQAKTVLASKDMTLPDALNLFVERVVAEQGLPMKLAEELQAEALAVLTADLDAGYQDVLAGRTKPAREVFAKYDL